MNINWYPGHMAKTRKLLLENISLVDAVIELSDARIPSSSRNPDLYTLLGNKKPFLTAYNKADLADPVTTHLWEKNFNEVNCVFISSSTGAGLTELMNLVYTMISAKIERNKARGIISTTLRVMIAGIPNSGKSTLINKLSGRRAAAAADKPGVTRGKQWIRINENVELLDTPGILWPKLDDPIVAQHLAFTGTIGDAAYDQEEVAAWMILKLVSDYPLLLEKRYKIDLSKFLDISKIILEAADGIMLLEEIGKKRGFLIGGGRVDILRTAIMLLDEFRGGKIGRITLERPH